MQTASSPPLWTPAAAAEEQAVSFQFLKFPHVHRERERGERGGGRGRKALSHSTWGLPSLSEEPEPAAGCRTLPPVSFTSGISCPCTRRGQSTASSAPWGEFTEISPQTRAPCGFTLKRVKTPAEYFSYQVHLLCYCAVLLRCNFKVHFLLQHTSEGTLHCIIYPSALVTFLMDFT